MSKILVCGDPHWSKELSYADYVKDRRLPEKQEVLDFIVEKSKDVDRVVFLGDITNTKTPSSEIIAELTNFLERFDKELFLISGNHCKTSDGRAVIDFLREIRDKNWHIVTNTIEKISDYVFLPYMFNCNVGAETNEEALKNVLEMLPSGKILFCHHSIEGSFYNNGLSVNEMPEIILPLKELKKYSIIFGGHVHKSQNYSNIIIAGSLYAHSTDDTEKYIWVINDETMKVDKIRLPGRDIKKLIDPTKKEIEELKEDSIVKVLLTKKLTTIKLDSLRKSLEDRFSATGGFMIIDQTKVVRDRVDYKESIVDIDILKLINIYSKEKQIDENKLLQGFELIK